MGNASRVSACRQKRGTHVIIMFHDSAFLSQMNRRRQTEEAYPAPTILTNGPNHDSRLLMTWARACSLHVASPKTRRILIDAEKRGFWSRRRHLHDYRRHVYGEGFMLVLAKVEQLISQRVAATRGADHGQSGSIATGKEVVR